MNPKSRLRITAFLQTHLHTSMAETLISPNPTMGHKKKLPMSARIQSPTTPFFVCSNDDQRERAQARAARAAAIRRKSLAANLQSKPTDSDPCLNKQQILDLFHNCIKLATENKINQKNTWELDLIDHLTDIIRAAEVENDVETNFQVASCTLEAGVKIYSLRVDSVHSEAYKVLAIMTRAGQEAEQDTTLESVNAEGGQEESKKGIDKKLSPLSTLESSFEVLNVKMFDVAFAVDPLYRQTSAQFDEGGAKGLLMNNLGVYGGCRVLFDSLEVPGKCIASQNDDISDTIDLSFARDCIEQMLLNMQMRDEISPTLRVIVNQFDENNRRPSDFQCADQKSSEEFDVAIECDIGSEREYENCPPWSDDHDNQTFVAELGSNDADPSFQSYPQEKEPFPSQDPDVDEIFESVDGYLFFSLGFRSNKNGWAGPDHWKNRRAKGSETEVHCTMQPKTKRQIEVDLDFTSFLEKKFPDIFSPPKNHKSLLLPENRPPCLTKLPEDCHYEPEDLVKLFLRPDCLGRRARKYLDGSKELCNDYESFPSWENGSVCDGEYDGDVHNDMDDSSTLISQPRRGQKEMVSFRHILANFPSECDAAAAVTDISSHLCFICLLHLANEKGLSIQSCPNLDDLGICLPDVDAT